MDVFATLIVSDDKAEQAREIASTIPGGEGMFTAPVIDGQGRRHYVSSGLMPEEIIAALDGLVTVSPLAPAEALAGYTIEA